ncbi:MAG: hypothetical protein OEX00_00780, partial [Gammaproteobacteria bacterium]|nr:hypothetical protein [Gammaproteobacteria bacterium]
MVASAGHANWSITGSSQATISSSGVVDTRLITQNQAFTVNGSYTYVPSNASHWAETKSVSYGTYARSKVPIAPETEFDTVYTVSSSGGAILENTANAQTFAVNVNWDDGSSTPINATWSDSSPNATINGAGVLSTGMVVSDEPFTVTAKYNLYSNDNYYPDYAGIITNNITGLVIVNTMRVFNSISIFGPDVVPENQKSIFSVIADFDDGSVIVFPDVWSENSNFATIDEIGVLTADNVQTDQAMTLTADFSYDGVTRSATKNVTISNNDNAVTSLSIIGPTSINEGLTATYELQANYEDGTVGTVVPDSWSIDSAFATVSTTGDVTGRAVTRGEVAYLYATYTQNGRFSTASLPLTIVNSERAAISLAIFGPSEIEEGTTANYSSRVTFDDGSSAVTPTWTIGDLSGAPTSYATVSPAGGVNTTTVPSTTAVRLSASYIYNGTTVTADQPISIIKAGSKSELTEKASSNELALQADAASVSPQFSGNGRYITFASDASNLVTDDTNGFTDIFVRDRAFGSIERVNINTLGEQANAASTAPSVDYTGRFIVFASTANNLIGNSTLGRSHVYVYDRELKQLDRVSSTELGMEGNGNSFSPVISSDAKYIAYVSEAVNLISGASSDTNGVADVYLYDRLNGVTSRISITDTELEANGASRFPSISGDGQRILFTSEASNLVDGDFNSVADVFVRDLSTQATLRVSARADGIEADLASLIGTISSDGTAVSFVSQATNLVDDGLGAGVFLRRVDNPILARAGVGYVGRGKLGLDSRPAINEDGRFIAYVSDMDNAGSAGNGQVDIMLFERDTALSKRISINTSLSEGNGPSFSPSVSSDARLISFASDASNLLNGDTNGVTDIIMTYRAANLEKRSVFLEPLTEVGTPGETLSVALWMDFSDDPTLGGSLDIGFDNSLLTYVDFQMNPQFGSDPELSRSPTEVSLVLKNLAFGNFDGLAGPQQVGTLVFNVLSGGSATFSLTENIDDLRGFYSSVDSAPQVTQLGGFSIPITSPPVANVGGSQIVFSGGTVLLNGSASTDDGSIVSYLWEQVSGTPVILSDANLAVVSFIAPNVALTETLVFRLTVTDDMGATGSAQVSIQVEPIELLPPTVNAGIDQSV